jgi:hypothetical protein
VFRFAAGATQSQQPVYTTEPPHWSKHVFATKHSVTVHAPALPPPLPAVPLVFAPPEFAPPVVLAPPDVAPPAFAPPRLGPPALAPPAPVPPAPAPLAPAFALPPSLEELEQPTHLTKHAKPIKTLLLAENRNAGFMPRSVPRARVPSAMRIGHHTGLGTATLLFLGVAARHWPLLPWHAARAACAVCVALRLTGERELVPCSNHARRRAGRMERSFAIRCPKKHRARNFEFRLRLQARGTHSAARVCELLYPRPSRAREVRARNYFLQLNGDCSDTTIA